MGQEHMWTQCTFELWSSANDVREVAVLSRAALRAHYFTGYLLLDKVNRLRGRNLIPVRDGFGQIY